MYRFESCNFFSGVGTSFLVLVERNFFLFWLFTSVCKQNGCLVIIILKNIAHAGLNTALANILLAILAFGKQFVQHIFTTCCEFMEMQQIARWDINNLKLTVIYGSHYLFILFIKLNI